ncbi:MAG: PilZ domain-containing protein [Candidatus Korobacteraceae bacterium]
MPDSSPDRRRYPRLPLSIPVFVRGTDKEGREFLEFATALNISAGGVLLATRRNLSRSATLSLEIPVAPLPTTASFSKSIRTLRARMVRSSQGDKYNLLGMKFSRPIGGATRPPRSRGKAASSK